MRSLLTVAFVCGLAHPVFAEPTREQVEFFERTVRPILVERCYSCHSDAAKKHKGNLVVDSLDGLLTGGDSGPALVPGKPAESKLIEAVGYGNEDLLMPPKGRIPAAEVAALTKWVAMGAPWPKAAGEAATKKRVPGKITDEDRDWWAFRQVKPTPPPAAGEGWARNEIDRFVAAKLAAAGLTPTPEAERPVLIRRLTFDLTGLPPTPEEVDAFVADQSPDAYERLVNRLLASPRYGERAARQWLDLVRYAESDGYRIDDYRPTAWRYRDYVIKSFNADKPYDRFVKEQIAGDELFPGDPDALTATGYLRHWIYEYNNRDVPQQWDVILNDLTDTTGDVVLGLGMQCARCHDHKFDPILQKDYFRLRAFFAAIRPRDDLPAATAAEKAEYAAKLKAWEEKTAAIREEIERIEAPYREKAAIAAWKKFPDDMQAMFRKPAAEKSPQERQLYELAYRQVDYEFNRIDQKFKPDDKEKVLALRKKLTQFDADKPAPLPGVLAMTDIGPVAPPMTIPKRGDTPVEPGFLTLLGEKPATIAAIPGLPDTTGRRATLANWLTRPDNQLTTRVIVNRVWQQHFGKGLAANPSDFGRLGEPPTHPELLDWLATRFVQDGWSLKTLHRLVVTSAIYRQGSSHPDPTAGKLKDAQNRLYWRANTRRLDAEQIRDSLYAVTGDLDPKAGGPGANASDPRRTVYCKVMRNNRDPLLDVFDYPYRFTSASDRDTTTTAIQSLLLINSRQMLARSKAFSDRLAKEEPSDEPARITRAYRLAFGRSPTTEEIEAARRFLTEQAKRIDPNKAASAETTFVAGKIPYRDGQAAEMKPAAGPSGYEVGHSDRMPTEDFTIEACVMPRSVDDTAAVRTIAAKWSGNNKQPGWTLGITGKQSRRKPQTVVLQMFGTKSDGSFGEAAVFSDHSVPMNKPYYLAASVRLAKGKEPGRVTFYLKDLSNDEEAMQVADVPHALAGGYANQVPFAIGGRGLSAARFDGLIDDVRLSAGALTADQLLYSREGPSQATVGHWQFEAKPSVFADASGHGFELHPAGKAAATATDVRKAAWVDFCHVLLNASEFLYCE